MERTNYMQAVMTSTYPNVAIEAIQSGFDGAWERCIARRLQSDVAANHSEASEICESVGNDYRKAAHLITSSKIIDTCATV